MGRRDSEQSPRGCQWSRESGQQGRFEHTVAPRASEGLRCIGAEFRLREWDLLLIRDIRVIRG